MEGAYLTIKQTSPDNIAVRSEFGVPIPVEDALEIMALSHYHTVVKQRHIDEVGGAEVGGGLLSGGE